MVVAAVGSFVRRALGRRRLGKRAGLRAIGGNRGGQDDYASQHLSHSEHAHIENCRGRGVLPRPLLNLHMAGGVDCAVDHLN